MKNKKPNPIPTTDLVFLDGDTPVTSTSLIAKETENEHASVIKLTRYYLSDLETMGRVRFEIEPFETEGGVQRREVAILNERQATYLIALMRNNDRVRAFKLMLVRHFWIMAERLNKSAPALPNFSDPVAAARAWADAKEQEQVAVAKLEAARPAVEFVERYVDSTGLKGFRQVAKLLKANEREFRAFLSAKGIMYRLGGEWVAYQQHIDAGRFAVKSGTSEASGHAFTQAKFTPKGIAWIAGLWGQHQLEQELGSAEPGGAV